MWPRVTSRAGSTCCPRSTAAWRPASGCTSPDCGPPCCRWTSGSMSMPTTAGWPPTSGCPSADRPGWNRKTAMIPVIALVGRPNVRKSTLFNRLTRRRNALVADVPGPTRDRQYGRGQFGEQAFVVIDTGGITGGEQGIGGTMGSQILQDVDEADLIFFMMDARDWLNGADQELAGQLRHLELRVYYFVIKIDGIDP